MSFESPFEIPTDPPIGQAGLSSITNANPGVFTLFETPGFVVGNSVMPTGVGGMSQVNNNFYVVDSITPVGDAFNVVLSSGGTPLNTTAFGTFTGGGTLALATNGGVSTSGVGTCRNNLFDSGAFNTIAWSAVTGAQRYNVYKLSNGLFGFIGQTPNLSFVDDNIAADISKTPPIQDNPFSSTDNYPGAVGYFEQRRCFAGVNSDPSYFWATRSATESSLAYSIPTRDDDAIRFRIAARERNSIRHIVPMANLVLLSETGEWRVAPASGEVLTPDVSVRSQSSIGAGHARPIIVNTNLLFAAARGGHVRELAYNFKVQGYITGDVSLRAPHLFDGQTLMDAAYAKSPIPIVWYVSSSGSLLGLTYVPEQDVGAWHEHTTAFGTFESICVVPEGEADVLYAVVRREMANGTQRFVERFEPRQPVQESDGFFVDCGYQYDGAATTSVSGLDWLEGMTVEVLADGSHLGQQVVTGGTITVSPAASKIDVGLPLVADGETLPLALEVAGFAQGRAKNVSAVFFKLYETREFSAGPTFDKLSYTAGRRLEIPGQPPENFTGELKIVITPSWNYAGTVCFRHSAPLPATLLAHEVEFVVGG